MDEGKCQAASLGSGERVGTLGEHMEGVEGGSCNNSEDVMVEVLGSDVFFDGVRSHEDDGEIDAVGDNKMDMDIDSKLPDFAGIEEEGSERVEPVEVESKDAAALKDVSESEVNRVEKEIADEGVVVVVAEASVVVEETQLTDDDGFVEETQLLDDEGFVEETHVVDEKKLVKEEEGVQKNKVDVVEYSFDKDVVEKSRSAEVSELLVETVEVASEGPVGPTGPSAPVETGTESADPIGATVDQNNTTLDQTEVHNEENPNVKDGVVECPSSVVMENSSSLLGEENLNLKGGGDDTRVGPLPEEGVIQSGGQDESVLEANTEASQELAPVSVEGEVKMTDGEEAAAVSDETRTSAIVEVKARVETVDACTEEHDGVLANLEPSSSEPTQIAVAGKTEKLDEKTCQIEQDLKPEEGCLDSKMDDSADVVEGSQTGQKIEANMDFIKKDEQVQEAIEQEPVPVESEARVDNNYQEMEGGRVTVADDDKEVEETLPEPVTGVDDITHDVVVDPSELSQPTVEEDITEDPNAVNLDVDVSDHILCESTEMDVQVTEHGECVLTVSEVLLSTNDDIREEVVDNNNEYLDGSLTVNLPSDDVGREQLAAAAAADADIVDVDEKQLAATDVDMADVDDEKRLAIATEEDHGETEEHIIDDEDDQSFEQGALMTETTVGGGVCASYNLPPQEQEKEEDDFAVSDLVWGKVRSHPWWPGQIFDPCDASETALKYHKKDDSYLVAYFGDRTFAWNEASSGLKPFRSRFSQLEKQSNSEDFQNAVDCALEEVSRRAELGLTCSCVSKEKINFQIVENDGIKEESCKQRESVDKSASANTFEPDKLVEYLKELAQLPYGGADRYELFIAKAQLLSFYRLKGGSITQLPEFQDSGELVENQNNRGDIGDELSADDDEEEEYSSGQENVEPQKGSSLKRKHNLRDITYPIKKGRSMKELMMSENNDDDMRRSISVAKGMNNTSTPPPPVPKPSFKIGECISRVASQLTGGSSILKQNAADPSSAQQNAAEDVEYNNPSEDSSLHDLLSRLQVAGQEPLKEHLVLNTVICFFSDFRNSAVLEQNPELGKMSACNNKRKRPSHLMDGSSEAFEFEDMNDSYWTDRIIENGGAEKLPSTDGGAAKRLENHIVPVELKPSHKTGRRPYTKRRHAVETNHGMAAAEKPSGGYIDPNAPAELVMIFSEFGFFPTEVNLNRMFKRFGPLRESDTELDRDTSRARVVFKKSSDAEVACSSAGRFNIFGPVHVIYQLNYTVSAEFKSMANAMIEEGGHEDDIIEG